MHVPLCSAYPQYSSLGMWLVSAEREGGWTPVCFCSELTIALWLMFKGSGVLTKDLAYDNITSECLPCNGGIPRWVCMQLSFPQKCYKVCPLVHGQFVVSSPRRRCGGMFGALLVQSDREGRGGLDLWVIWLCLWRCHFAHSTRLSLSG